MTRANKFIRGGTIQFRSHINISPKEKTWSTFSQWIDMFGHYSFNSIMCNENFSSRTFPNALFWESLRKVYYLKGDSIFAPLPLQVASHPSLFYQYFTFRNWELKSDTSWIGFLRIFSCLYQLVSPCTTRFWLFFELLNFFLLWIFQAILRNFFVRVNRKW